MKCSRNTGRGFWARSCLLALLLLAASSWAVAQDQPTSPPPPPDTTLSSQTPTYTWDQLSSLSDQLLQSSNDLVNSAVTLNQKLDQLQLYLSESTTALQASVALRKQEEAAAQAQVKSALNRSLWWQRGLFLVGGGFVGYLVDGWKGALYGVGGAATIDAGIEIFSIHL